MLRFTAKIGLFYLAVALSAVGLSPLSAAAASPYELYSAAEASGSTTALDLAPGQTAQVTARFRNIGQVTWRNTGANFISIYSYEPTTLKYRQSAFADSSWRGQYQPVMMSEASVAPGQTGTFVFKLRAPSQAGHYQESFRVGIENLIWMPGGRFDLDITVAGTPVATAASASAAATAPTTATASPSTAAAVSSISAPAPATPAVTVTETPASVSAADASAYGALMLIASDRQLSLDAGQSKDLRLGFKNVGQATWERDGSTPLRLRLASGTADALVNPAWNGNVAAVLPAAEVQPGQLAIFDVHLVAPAAGGTYTPKFELMAGDATVTGGDFELPVEIHQPMTAPGLDRLYSSDFVNVGPRGPDVRLGLFDTHDPVVIAASGAYTLRDANGATIKDLSGMTTVTFDWASRTYFVANNGYSWVSSLSPTFVPDDPASAIFQITNYEDRPTWDPSLNFNQFRGSLEVAYAPTTNRLWVIEELPMEDYLRGLAETSNGSPYEFQKALVTAARTYALFVLSIGGKHASEFHDLQTNGNDQVYKGYVSELVRPNVVRAVEETRGIVVSYGGDIVVTPYFSRSDGRTRAWTEVWGGQTRPWLVSKPAPYDAGQTLWGHGVGLSASDAIGRANAGTSWQDILKYYYTGIDLKRLY